MLTAAEFIYTPSRRLAGFGRGLNTDGEVDVHLERRRAIDARYRARNRARVKKRAKAWRVNNPGKVAAWKRRWEEANRDRINAARRARYAKNLEKMRAVARARYRRRKCTK